VVVASIEVEHRFVGVAIDLGVETIDFPILG